MTVVAIEKLNRAENGFYLFVEGGRIDHGHHETQPIRALNDFVAFDEAIGAALAMVDLEETLVLVTADHSHTFTLGATGVRGANLFGPGDYEKKHIGHDGELPLIGKV